MKIIDEGKGPVFWTKRIVCKSCNAVLEIGEEDLRFRNTAIGYAGETWCPSLFVECAVCYSNCYVTNEVPSGIQIKIYNQHRSK